jgi:NAD(P) transhydrogenase subunit beta
VTATGIVTSLANLVAIALFIYGLHELNSPATARRGNRLAMVGMAIALVSILVQTGALGWWAVAVGVAIGGLVGIYAALKVKMTAMPQMVALCNGAGGGAAALISTVQFFIARDTGGFDAVIAVSLVLSAIIGAISLAGSIVAFLKLQELMTGRPVTYPGQQIVNALVLIAILGLAAWFVATLGVLPAWAFVALLLAALLLGVLFVLPIGGADMPVVISLLNSFTGVAVAITGFEIDSPLLIICGALVGASGTILTVAMSRAMNRPLTNVLFGAFGAAGGTEVTSSSGPQQIRSTGADDGRLRPRLRHGGRTSAA